MKTRPTSIKSIVQIVAGCLSLAALLSYTLVHTGGLLSSYVRPGLVGYVAAFGIELSIVGLSLRIGDLRKSGQNVKFFVSVLVAVVVVSALANIAEGFRVNQGIVLTVETFSRLDAVQAVVGLAATGLISLIVFALAEIVGTDVNAAVRLSLDDFYGTDTRKGSKNWKILRQLIFERDDMACTECGKDLSKSSYHCHHTKMVSEGGTSDPDNLTTLCVDCHDMIHSTAEVPSGMKTALATSLEKVTLAKGVAMGALLDYVAGHPNASLSEIGRVIGRSKTTAGEYVDELTTAGKLKRNGHGFEVNDAGSP